MYAVYPPPPVLAWESPALYWWGDREVRTWVGACLFSFVLGWWGVVGLAAKIESFLRLHNGGPLFENAYYPTVLSGPSLP